MEPASLTCRTRLPILAGAVTVVLVLAAPASGKVWFQKMTGRHLRVGQHVSSVILGCPGNPSCREAVEGARVYLHRIGATRRGRHLSRVSASGRIAFDVPSVRPGRYRLLARVHTDRGWRTLTASEIFRVVARR
jgi:hypothetical protein